MLQVWATPALEDARMARLERLAGDLVIATWRGPGDSAAAPIRPKLDGALAPRPYLVLSVPLRAGGEQHVALLRWPELRAGRFSAEAGDVVVATASLNGGAELPRLDASALMAGLDPAARRRLVRGICAHLAGIGARRPGAAAAATALFAALWPSRPALRPVCRVTSQHRLHAGKGELRLGRLVDTFVLTPAGLKSVKAAAAPVEARGDGQRVQAVLPDADEATDVLFLGSSGLGVFHIESAGSRELPPLLAWAERHKDKAAGRIDELVRMLQELAGRAPEAAAAMRELQLLAPRVAARVGLEAASLQAMIEVAVADGAGLLVAGWLDDPQHLVAGLALERSGATPRSFSGRHHRYPRRLRKPDRDGEARPVEGFVAYLPDAPEAQHRLHHRFHLRLHSGGSIPLNAPAQPADPAAARAAVLGCVKTEAVTPALLADCLAPAVAALHRRCLQGPREPEIVSIGTPLDAPDFTVIVPLYRNLDFLKFQVACFAVDPDRDRSEIIYVLDSPEQRLEVEHLLRGLWRLHDLPMTLLVNPDNLGYAAANNLAAARARGRVLALVNSDVLPIEPGWLDALDRRLVAQPTLGAVGPKLLFEDQSLQHAGMYFARDLTGRWLNHHYHKGLPRFFPAAQVERPVPALTGACLVVRRAAFESVGGFTEDYVIGDYEDSDLCLKLRREGHDLAYVPSVELYHLERRSIRHHAGYMKGVACLYNSWLHAQRWEAEMARLSGDGKAPVRDAVDTGPDAPSASIIPTPPLEVAAE